MHNILNLDKFPINDIDSVRGRELVNQCKQDLRTNGMFNLDGFLLPEAINQTVSKIMPLVDTVSFNHAREHNIYFKPSIPELAQNHPALVKRTTSSYTICADQISDSILLMVYNWQPFIDFLSTVMEKQALYAMEDPLAKLNVMAYRDGQQLSWHFDRSEFTTTLLLQSPVQGGDFEYRTDLRSQDNPNYDGVAKLLTGDDASVKRLHLTPGTLNVFKGKNTAHRVTPVKGDKERIISVFSYFQKQGVVFTDEERIGFYGRTE